MKREAAAVTALFLAITVVFAYPLSLHPATTILGGGADPYLCLWLLAWGAHAFTRQPLRIFDAPIFAPLPNTLAYAENLIGSALLAAPVIWLTGNALLAMNLVGLLSVPLGGIGAWLLGRRLGLSAPAAVIAGLVFAFAPPRFLRLEQFQLTTIAWIPFCLAFLHGYLDTGRRRDLRLALAAFSLQALTAGHGAVFLTVGVALVLTWRFAMGEPLAVLRRIRDVGVTGALILAPAIAVFLPYRRAQAEVGLHRTLEGWDTSLASFFASPSHVDDWLGSFLPARLRENPDAYLFPGLITLALVAGAWVLAVRAGRLKPAPPAANVAAPASAGWRDRLRRSPLALYTVMTLLCLWLLLGPPLGVWQWVYRWPGLSLVRVPTRFILLGMVSLGVLAGIGFDRIFAHRRPRARAAAGAVVGLLLLVEFAAMPLPTRPYPVEIPAIDRWLDTQPKPFTVAEYPMHDPDNLTIRERQNVYYMLYATAHWQKTVHGYSGWLPPAHEKLYEAFSRFPDDESLRQLAAFKVTYVLVHLYDIEPQLHADLLARLDRYKDWLRLEHTEEGGLGRVYQLRR